VTRLHLLLAQTTTTDDSDPLDFVSDFFDSEEWLVVRNVTLFFLVVFWLASAYWVYKDARSRIDDPWLLAMAWRRNLPRSSGPFYMFFRPPEYIEDVRATEIRARRYMTSPSAPGLPRGDRDDVLACRSARRSWDSCRRCRRALETAQSTGDLSFCELRSGRRRAVENLSGWGAFE
jgi:hypothetical protein